MKHFTFSAIVVFTLSFFSCQKEKVNNISIIPQPASVDLIPGDMTFNKNTAIFFEDISGVEQVAVYLADFLIEIGYHPAISKLESKTKPDNSILFQKADMPNELGDEGYRLTINKKNISILANTSAGFFYGVQSLLQLIPNNVLENKNDFAEFEFPCLEIIDKPRFSYRGMHLDVCRHFFSVDFIKRYIDLLTMYKFNTFHWHLTDDQGWRIEIRKYPKLTEIAAFRDSTLLRGNTGSPVFDGKKYGGFYTQEQIKEIVKYAADRQITIIPEIEMPGHSLAALSAFPELACTSGPFQTATTWGVFEDIFCTKDQTFEFLTDVLTEVMILFPGKYIHIGGDEAPKNRWQKCPVCQSNIIKHNLKDEHELQSWFVKRIDHFLNENGRQLIGWDEILEGGISPNATIMSWRGLEGGIAASKQGHDAIMTPVSNCYFDYYQADPEFQPFAIGGFTTLKEVYFYEPVPTVLNSDEAQHILGAQANVWTEYLETPAEVEYMILPRMAALAEVDWSLTENKNWPDFQRRINEHYKWYQIKGLNYCPGSFRVEYFVQPDSIHSAFQITLESEIYQPEIRYTTDGSIPDSDSRIYSLPFSVPAGTSIQAAVFVDGKIMEKPAIRIIE